MCNNMDDNEVEEIIMKETMDELNNVKLEWPNHKHILIDSLWKSFSNNFLFDFELVCEENVFGAHAVILSALCEIFSLSKLNCDKSNKQTGKTSQFQFEISGINGELSKCFLEFIYRGKTSLPPDSLKAFLALLKQAKIRGLDELEVNYPAKDSVNMQVEENVVTNSCENEDLDSLEDKSTNVIEDTAANVFSSEQLELEDISIIEDFQIDADIDVNLKTDELFEDVNTVCRTTLDDVIAALENKKSRTASFNDANAPVKKKSDDNSVKSTEVNELVISKATHFCECSFNIPRLSDRHVCSVSAVLRHCGCRLDEQQLFSVSFLAQEDIFSTEYEQREQLNKCCLCSTDVPIEICAKPLNSNEITKNLLDNYLTNMMDLSLPLDEIDNFIEPQKLRKDSYLRSILESNQPIYPDSFENWRNSFTWKRRGKTFSHKSIQTDDLLPKNAKALERQLFCSVCKCEFALKAALELHMVAIHNYKLPSTPTSDTSVREIRKRLNCSYCDFRAVSERLLACHLTDVHKGMIISNVSQTGSGRVLRSRTQTNKPVYVTPSPVKLEFEETNESEIFVDIESIDKTANKSDDELMIVDVEDKHGPNNRMDKPSAKRKLNMKSVVVKKNRKIKNFNTLKNNGATTSDTQNVDEKLLMLNCETCGFETTSLFGLKCHRLEHTGESPFQCDTCKENFVSKSALIMHMLNHASPDDFYKCGICKFATPFKTRIDLHMKQQHDMKVKFKCHYCKKLFNSRSACDAHRKIHSRHNSYLKKNIQLELPMKKKTAKQFLCPKCDFFATEAKLLYRHVYENHLGET